MRMSFRDAVEGQTREVSMDEMRASGTGWRIVGVDAEYAVGQLVGRDAAGPAVCTALEGLAGGLRATVGAKAVFVFPGMPFATVRPEEVRQPPPRRGLDEAVVVCAVARLKAAGVAEAMVAPYWAGPQLAVLRRADAAYAAEVYGPPELLLYRSIDRVIVGLDIERRRMRVVRRADVARELLRYNVDLVGAALAAVLERGGYADDDCREAATRGVYHCPVMTHRSMCVPLSSMESLRVERSARVPPPCDYAGTFGRPLPRLLYYLLMHGALSPSLAWSYAACAVFDRAAREPTDDAVEQRKFLVPLRAQVAHQLAQTFMDAPDEYDMVWACDDGSVPVPLRRPPRITLDEWDVPEPAPSVVSFRRVMVFAGCAVPPEAATARYASRAAALCAIHLKTLDLLGYFTHAIEPGEDGSSGMSHFAEAVARCSRLDDALGDAAVVLVELLRTQTLHERPLAGRAVADGRTDAVRVAARVCSLVPLSPWLWRTQDAGADDSHGAFNGMVCALHRALRALAEAVAAGVVLRGWPTALDDVPGLAAGIPFLSPPGAEAARVVQFALECGRRPLLPEVMRRFAAPDAPAADVLGDLKRVFDFWCDARDVVAYLAHPDHEPCVPANVAGAVEDADALMTAAMRALSAGAPAAARGGRTRPAA